MTTTGIKLDDQTRQRLKALAELKKRSPHWLMKTAVMEYLEREETYEREKQEDMERWERYQATGECVSHEDMTVWLDELAEAAARKARKAQP